MKNMIGTGGPGKGVSAGESTGMGKHSACLVHQAVVGLEPHVREVEQRQIGVKDGSLQMEGSTASRMRVSVHHRGPCRVRFMEGF